MDPKKHPENNLPQILLDLNKKHSVFKPEKDILNTNKQ